MRSRFGKTLLHLATVLFVLNTASAYGACCFMPADTEVETKMPCHTGGGGAAEVPADDCCATCVPVPQLDNDANPFVVDTQTKLIASSVLIATTGFDPPYRPPIHHFS